MNDLKRFLSMVDDFFDVSFSPFHCSILLLISPILFLGLGCLGSSRQQISVTFSCRDLDISLEGAL